MHSLLVAIALGLAAAVATVTLAFGISRLRGRNDVADIAWGVGFIAVALTTYLTRPSLGHSRPLIVTLLVVIWGSRLAYHILRRHRRTTEDKRYQAMKATWKGSELVQSYLRVFLSQGLLLWLIALPVIIINTTSRASLGLLDAVAIAIWAIGFVCESSADAQLAAFLAVPEHKGQLLTTGLWRYSRHPNYFGELTQWWGIGLLALSVPFGYLGLLGPALLTILITKVSGVPLTEQRYAGRPDWEDYKSRTSVLIPLPPHRPADWQPPATTR